MISPRIIYTSSALNSEHQEEVKESLGVELDHSNEETDPEDCFYYCDSNVKLLNLVHFTVQQLLFNL